MAGQQNRRRSRSELQETPPLDAALAALIDALAAAQAREDHAREQAEAAP